MKQSKKKLACPSLEGSGPQVRRSQRTHRAPKNEEYMMGNLDQILGLNPYEEDYHPKRRRKNHRYDDSDDYDDGPRYSRKNNVVTLNKVEGLLEWKKSLGMLDMSVSFLSAKDALTPVEQISRVRTCKQIVGQNLLQVADNLEAIFVNIEWDKKGQTLKDFQQLKLESNKLMPKGLVFVWAPKQYISGLLSIMEKKDFVYVQNLEIINLDIDKAVLQAQRLTKTKFDTVSDVWSVVKCLEQANPVDLIADSPSPYFNSSKRTLLMFKKNNNMKFELRHQRTCDVVFDMPLKKDEKCAPDTKAYIYNMIEVLLPDCLDVVQKGKNQFGLKMLELWASKDQPRRGWVHLIQE